MAVISVRCLGRGAEPLLPLKEALASYLGRTPDQIRRTLARAAPALLDAVPFIGAFLASIGEKLAEGSFSLRGVYEELSRILIKATSGNTGLFLLVDDLHAADPDTLYFLNYLFRKLRQVPVLAAATIQEEQLGDYPELADLMAEWSAAGHVTVTVVPLERAHAGEYVRMMTAAGEAADESIVDRLFRLTGGNPFFLREAVSLITGSPGSPLAGDVVLPRADAILRRRLARADDMTRHFLRAASVVLDTSDDLAAITYVMQGDTKDAIAALNKACELRLMREGPRGEVSFVHALMQREVYAEMGANQRRYLHARAGEWSGRNGAMASAAFHFEQAGQIDHMVQAGYQAAAQAERAGMYHTALMLYQKLRPHVSIEELGPRLAGVLIILGDWPEAEKLTGLLPVEDSQRPAAPLRASRSSAGISTAPWPRPRWRSSAIPPNGSRCSSAWPTSRCTSAISAKRSGTGVRLSTWPAPPMPACAPAVTASWPPPRPGSVMPWNFWRTCPKPTATA